MLTHTNERPYPCRHCPKSFKDPSNRVKHERHVHEGIPYGKKKDMNPNFFVMAIYNKIYILRVSRLYLTDAEL